MKKRYAIIAALLSVLCSCGSKEVTNADALTKPAVASVVSQVVGIGKIEPENSIIQLSAPVNGIVVSILKSENDTVSAGTPIIELDSRLEEAKVTQLTAELNTQLNQLKADEAGLGEYEAKCSNAVSELQCLQRLLGKGAETQQVVDDANTNLKTLQSNLKRLQAGIAASRSRVAQSQAALNTALIERDQKTIKSPVAGKILELTTLAGSSVDTKQSVVQISPLGRTIAICEIDELFADKVAVGQKAWIRNVGSTDTLSAGVVYTAFSFLKKKSLFTDQAGEKEDRRVRTVKIMLDQPDKLLLNARVECVIDISGNLKK